MYRVDRFLALGALLASIALFINSSGLNAKEQMHHGQLGSGFWPMLLLGLIALGSLALTVRSFRTGPEALLPSKSGRPLKVAALMGFTFFYAWCIQVMGFLLATPFFLLTLLYALGMRQVLVLICVPLGLTGVLGLLFLKVFALPFPLGHGVFRALHLWVL